MARIIRNPEGGRFYRPDGTVVFEVPMTSKDGMRDPTIADAKKHGWCVSVTEVLKLLDKAFLNTWKLQHILEVGIENPIAENETADQWILRVHELSGEYASLAADRGKEIHAAVDNYFRVIREKGKAALPDDPACERACREISAHYGDVEILTEVPFVSPLGFAGTADLVINNEILGDIKTKDLSKSFTKPSFDMGLQLGGYNTEFQFPYLDEVIVDRNTGETRFFRWGKKWKRTQSQSPKQLEEAFLKTFSIWQMKNQFFFGK